MLSFLLFKSIAKGNSFLKVFKKSLPPQDARRFYRGHTNPLVMMGVKRFRVLPDF